MAAERLLTRRVCCFLAGIYGGSLTETTLSQISVHGCVLAGVFLGFGYMNRVEDCDMSVNGVGLVSTPITILAGLWLALG